MPAYLLALDQGTTSSRAFVFDADAHPLAFAQRPFTQHFPQPGRVEHDALEIFATQLAAGREALEKAGIAASELAAIGITNQRETTVLWDRDTGEPVAPAIVWQDRRTAAACDALRGRGLEALVTERTGLLLDPYFSATKIAWLLDNVAGLRAKADQGRIAFGTIDTWLVWKLTNGARHVTDYTNASRTMLFDIAALRWDDELLAAFDVPRAVLPEAMPCTAEFGAAAEEHFGAKIPICGIAGDQQAALVGQLCFEPGLAKNTYGTGSFVVLNTGERITRSRSRLLATVGYAFESGKATYALEGSVFSTGATVQWLRDGLGVIDDASEIEALARSVNDSGDVFVVPAFAGLGAPYWDPYARGTIVGITRGTTKAHLAHAVLESTAYQTADVVAAMETDAGLRLSELRVDGGAAVNDFLMQLQADALGVTVARPPNVETTVLGAAYLAGLQRGVWRDLDALRAHAGSATRFVPSAPPDVRAARLERWHRAVERSRGWAK